MVVVGAGIAILGTLWTTAAVAAAVLSRARRPTSFAAPAAILTTAGLITIFMWLGRPPPAPDGFSEPPPFVVYDHTWFDRLAVVLVAAAGLLGGVGAVFVFHVSVSRRPVRLKAAWELDLDEF